MKESIYIPTPYKFPLLRSIAIKRIGNDWLITLFTHVNGESVKVGFIVGWKDGDAVGIDDGANVGI